MTAPRPVLRLGDAAVSASVPSVGEAHALAAAATARWRPPGAEGAVEDVVPGFRSVTVVADPDRVDLDELALSLATLPGVDAVRRRPRVVELPVTFDGPDLEEVARLAGWRRHELVGALGGMELQVAFLGFAPGFAYLVGLPPVLATLPRRASPRSRVPAGSVAVGGGFAGVYPASMPGGWQLVGRSASSLFDPAAATPAVLAPGDTVRFVPAEDGGPPPARGAGAAGSTGRAALRAPRGNRHRHVVVEDPGLLTFVQDAGRIGVAALGVPRAGAADPDAFELANRLVGNHPGAAVLECTARGAALRFAAAAHVAVVGRATAAVDGRPVHGGTVVPVARGQRLQVGAVEGDLRAYVAIDGGIHSPVVLGSRSSDTLSGLGPGPLAAGDELALGPPTRPRGRLVHPPGAGAGGAAATGPRPLRVLLGPDPLPPRTLTLLTGSTWTVGGASDRVGLRLEGPRLPVPAAGLASRGVVTGVVQVPPDGAPIVLGCDHATVGGYPVAATVARADLGELGRCRPGDEVVLEPISLADAARLRAERRRALDRQVVGWYPSRTD